MKWKWETATARERADMVRSHASGNRPLGDEDLKKLFLLTDLGVQSILRGDDWKREYSSEPSNG